jgi:hypothetical protein
MQTILMGFEEAVDWLKGAVQNGQRNSTHSGRA